MTLAFPMTILAALLKATPPRRTNQASAAVLPIIPSVPTPCLRIWKGMTISRLFQRLVIQTTDWRRIDLPALRQSQAIP